MVYIIKLAIERTNEVVEQNWLCQHEYKHIDLLLTKIEMNKWWIQVKQLERKDVGKVI